MSDKMLSTQEAEHLNLGQFWKWYYANNLQDNGIGRQDFTMDLFLPVRG
jgi:hypothetical protein